MTLDEAKAVVADCVALAARRGGNLFGVSGYMRGPSTVQIEFQFMPHSALADALDVLEARDA